MRGSARSLVELIVAAVGKSRPARIDGEEVDDPDDEMKEDEQRANR